MNLPVTQQSQQEDQHIEPFLAADVGGTHVRVGLVVADAGGICPVRVAHYRVYRGAEWMDLVAVLKNFIDELANTAFRETFRMKLCVVACAGYVVDDRVVSENLPWPVSVRDTRERLNVDQLELINDFAAMAWGIPCVGEDEAQVVVAAPTQVGGEPVLVIGPGTGLGAGVFLPGAPYGQVLRTEAGHASLAPGNSREMAILEVLALDRPYVAIGDALSGPGLLNLYRAICDLENHPRSLTSPAEITHAAMCVPGESEAAEAVQVFCGLLGSFVGDLVLLYGARGGVYLTGSILPQVASLLVRSTFVERYFNKGVMAAYLRNVPVRLVEQGQRGVVGAALWYLANRRMAHDGF